MSLLLEALKKAELAKQMAKAETGPPGSPPEPTQPVMTREKLPDISQPLEILTDDLPSSVPKAPAPKGARTELSLEPDSPSQTPPFGAPSAGEPQAGSRAQAQQLFQVKEMDYNPRRPFYLTLAALALVGVGYGGYLWWQLRPKPSVGLRASTEAASAPAGRPAPAASAPAPSLAAEAAAGAQPPGVAPSAGSGAPGASVETIPPLRPVRAAPRAVPGPGRVATRQGPVARERPVRTELQSEPAQPLAPISIKPPRLVVDPLVEQAYEAFQKNDLPTARERYQQVLAREPNNRDALLGLAAIDLRTGNLETAQARYLRLLELDPRDPYAVAGVAALRGQLDPVRSESRLKTLIATQPNAAQLYFALGNEYAQQARWSDAQGAYFKAYAADPENGDYAFNLAVSLDQLKQRKPALQYYLRAIALAQAHPVSFDRGQAQARVDELGKGTGTP